ncbi:glycosyltransferase [Patescibacteria group bacterium]|nr:glycosyltransferase [Patescibacteria group bacterium]
MSTSSNGKPFVSIIVPVYNRQDNIDENIKSLLAQDYPKDKYEIIIIDNGSTDRTLEIIKKHPVVLLEEKEVRTSYAARNKGINFSKGEIIAFTDSDCIAFTDWLTRGVEALSEHGGVIGGRIKFKFSEHRTAAELLDSLVNLDNKLFIEQRHAAQTANLFTYKDLFNKIGLFESKEASGGDAVWTHLAWKSGNKLSYAPEAVVWHLSRDLKELCKKHFRVGTGCLKVWKAMGRSPLWVIVRFISLLVPFLSLRVPILVIKRGDKEIKYPILKMMGVAYVCTIYNALGITRSLFKSSINI